MTSVDKKTLEAAARAIVEAEIAKEPLRWGYTASHNFTVASVKRQVDEHWPSRIHLALAALSAYLAASPPQEGELVPVAWEVFYAGAGSVSSETFVVRSEASMKQHRDAGADITPLYGHEAATRIAELTARLAEAEERFFWPDAKRRLWFISDHVAKHETINRADICKAFGVSIPQASNDLRDWMKMHPRVLAYDKSKKCYRLSKLTTVQALMAYPKTGAIGPKTRFA